MATLRQLASAAQSQNTRERIRAALWRVSEERLGRVLPEEASPEEIEQDAKIKRFAQAASRFTENWIALFAVRGAPTGGRAEQTP